MSGLCAFEDSLGSFNELELGGVKKAVSVCHAVHGSDQPVASIAPLLGPRGGLEALDCVAFGDLDAADHLPKVIEIFVFVVEPIDLGGDADELQDLLYFGGMQEPIRAAEGGEDGDLVAPLCAQATTGARSLAPFDVEVIVADANSAEELGRFKCDAVQIVERDDAIYPKLSGCPALMAVRAQEMCRHCVDRNSSARRVSLGVAVLDADEHADQVGGGLDGAIAKVGGFVRSVVNVRGQPGNIGSSQKHGDTVILSSHRVNDFQRASSVHPRIAGFPLIVEPPEIIVEFGGALASFAIDAFENLLEFCVRLAVVGDCFGRCLETRPVPVPVCLLERQPGDQGNQQYPYPHHAMVSQSSRQVNAA